MLFTFNFSSTTVALISGSTGSTLSDSEATGDGSASFSPHPAAALGSFTEISGTTDSTTSTSGATGRGWTF